MSLIVLGVDPGSRVTGYGLVGEQQEILHHLDSGQINLPARLPQSQRLLRIYQRLTELLGMQPPGALAVEEVFLARNVQSALKLGQVRGVVLLAAAQAGVPVFEYSPLVLKKAVVGYGQASKDQVKMMVEQLLGQTVTNHNAADALALSICHLFHARQQRLISGPSPV
ncbi:MAG: crossover junction endodeoxyribonuclease RuvC [Desulfobacca sp.]|nr:crossover junction endodeoxyribonuclease RuvC [Desulfobacca sp.]